jgi:hypothetical protein
MPDLRDRQATFAAILEHSTSMLAAAGLKQWDTVIARETERRKLLMNDALIIAGCDDAAHVLREVLAIDACTVNKLRLARDACGDELRALRRGASAIQTYAGVAQIRASRWPAF